MSGCLNVRRLLALRALNHLEGHLLTFLQRLEPVHLDGREMRKQILAPFIRRNEPEALRVVEPLDRTSCHTNFPCNSHVLPRARSKSSTAAHAAAPSAQAHLGIFSYLHLLQPAEKKCQLDCWMSFGECQANFEMMRVPLRAGVGVQGFSEFPLCGDASEVT